MEWLTLFLSIIAGILGLWYFFLIKYKKLNQFGIIHPKPWPYIGNLGPFVFKRCSFTEAIDRIYKWREDVDYVGFYVLTTPIILIRSLELIKKIAIKNFDHFVDHSTVIDPDVDPLFGKNLTALRGEKWKEVRHLLTPAFTSSKMKAMFNLMSQCGKKFTDHLLDLSCGDKNVIDTKEAFTRYTTDVIATCAFGISVDSMKNPNNDFYTMGRGITKFSVWLSIKMTFVIYFPRLSKFFNLRINAPSKEKFFSNVIKETIDTRDREGITRPDMIQLMMETRGNKIGEGPEMTIQDMTAQAFVFFIGGFEPSSTTMCFAAHEIAVNEDVQIKLQKEIDDVMEKTNDELTYESLNEMQYLDAVVNETLRLYPVGPFLDRVCVKKFELPSSSPGGKTVTIEPGQIVWLPPFSIHRDPKYYPNPTKFDPERFMANRKKDMDPSIYFPFGLGPRMCIGNRFALMETKVVLFYLLSKCNLKPSAKTLVPLKFAKSNPNMMAEGGFWLQLESRNKGSGKVMENFD